MRTSHEISYHNESLFKDEEFCYCCYFLMESTLNYDQNPVLDSVEPNGYVCLTEKLWAKSMGSQKINK